MAKSILVTGGAGFIGSFLVDELVKQGHVVRILDNLDSQVHPNQLPPSYLNPDAEFVQGDVLDRDLFAQMLKGVEIVYHMASCVGVGQSQYEVARYTQVNCGGTATLWDIIIQDKLDIEKVIVPGSMTSFGEGASRCNEHGEVKPNLRQSKDVANGDFRCRCPVCSHPVVPIPTSHNYPMSPSSVYAISKKVQEDLTINLGKTYEIPSVVLRYFNVYGPRQSLSNPYTGVSAIFLSRIKNGKNPVVYEDGEQTRDFISVHDVVKANISLLSTDVLDYKARNLGSGNPVGIKHLAQQLITLLKSEATVEVTGKFRKGDIRHCFADAKELEKFDFRPQISLEQGMLELSQWAENEKAEDKFETATRELRNKGLL